MTCRSDVRPENSRLRVKASDKGPDEERHKLKIGGENREDETCEMSNTCCFKVF